MINKGPKNPERAFGVSVGVVLMLIAAYALWRQRITLAEVLGGIGLALFVLGRVRPAWLKWPSAAWWKLAMALGYVNARLILTVVFALVFVPMGLLWRLIGRDPMRARRPSQSGWTPYPARYRDRSHYTRMY